jgi:hypothetical protein
MDLAALYTAIRGRLGSDLTLSGHINGAWNNVAPTGQAMPFVVYSVASCSADNAFAKDCYEVLLRLRTYVPRANFTNPISKLSTITNLVYASLHRFTPTLAGSAWTATAIQCIDSQDEPDDDAYSQILTFQLWLHK